MVLGALLFFFYRSRALPPPDPATPTAQDWAEACGTIGYEIVTRLGARVPRVARGGGREGAGDAAERRGER